MKLYEIAEDYRRFMAAIEDGDLPEEVISDTLEALEGAFEVKADNIACLIKELEAEAEAIKAEAATLTERAKAKARRAERLRGYLGNAMITLDMPSIETTRNCMKFTKSEAVQIDDERAFVEWAAEHDDSLLTYKDPVPNKTAIKAAIKGGMEIEGARLEQRKNLQIK